MDSGGLNFGVLSVFEDGEEFIDKEAVIDGKWMVIKEFKVEKREYEERKVRKRVKEIEHLKEGDLICI